MSDYHFQITPFAISGLLIIITYLPLFLFIVIKGKTKLTQIFALHIFSVLIWGGCAFGAGISTTFHSSVKFLMFGCLGVLFIPVFFQHAILLLTKKKSNIYLSFVYAQAFFFSYFDITNQLWSGPKLINNLIYFKGTPIFFCAFTIWIIVASIPHFQLFTYYKKCYPQEKKQILALILAVIGFLGGINNFISASDINIYPYGNFLVPIHSITISYAILKHQLLDINIAFKKGVVYTTLLGLITFIYVISIILIEKILQNYFQYSSIFASVIVAFLIGLIFLPLRRKIQALVDKYMFRGSPEEIALQNEKLREQIAQSEKYKTLSTLASGVAHEIKNPLTAIQTFSEYLPQKLDDKEFLQKFSKIVKHEVFRINELVHQLMDYGKPAPINLQPTDIHKLINDTAEFFSNECVQHKINLQRQFNAPKNTSLTVDPNQIRQALINIIFNAIEAMPRSGNIIITTSLAKRFIISIKDNGKGMAKEELAQIFDPFYTNKDNGTGLGLPITQSIIEKHQGRIIVKSQKGAGTEIIIELPL